MSRRERKDTLDKLVESRAMSLDGANWVRKSLDPFHDFDFRIAGLPDCNTSKVVIQEVTKSLQLSAGAIVGTWDCHIATMPEIRSMTTVNELVTLTDTVGTTSSLGLIQPASLNIGPILISSVPSGASTFPNVGSPLNPAQTIQSLDFSEYFDGQKRLIAFGFEVHDTTASLYQQGTCTVYKMPQTNCPGQGRFTRDGITFIEKYEISSRLPPDDISKALLFNGARQWEAREGAYCVCTMDVERCDLEGSVYAVRNFTQGDSTSTATRANITAMPVANESQLWKPTPFHTSGAYFTGLNTASTLTLTVKLIFETAPTQENAQLVVLAQPSPLYDPVAMEIYKKASSMLPPGVQVKFNASGDFWDQVLSFIKTSAPALSALGGPGAAIGGGLSAGAGLIQSLRNRAKTPVKVIVTDKKIDKILAPKPGYKPPIPPKPVNIPPRVQKTQGFGSQAPGQKNSVANNTSNTWDLPKDFGRPRLEAKDGHQCPACPKQFASKTIMAQHIINKH